MVNNVNNINDLKLGKLPVRKDIRTIPYRKVRVSYEVLPPPPDTYDDQAAVGVTDTQMFLNDIYGDCVVAAAYHVLMVLEKIETGKIILPTSDEVKNTYFGLTGGQDTGLVELDFLNYWRQNGIPMQGKPYKIAGFTSVDWKNHLEVMDVCYYLKTVFTGVSLPLDAQTQFKNGQPWTVTTGGGGTPGGWGGHAMYGPAYLKIVGFNQVGPVFETWGKRQQATWDWWDTYLEEMYGLVPAQNISNSPIDVSKFQDYLNQIIGQPSSKVIITTLGLPSGTVGVDYNFPLGAAGGTPPYTWSLGTGVFLPGGLSLSSDGIISGIPTVSGYFGNLGFSVVDSMGNGTGLITGMTIVEPTPPVPNPPASCGCPRKLAKLFRRNVKIISGKGR